MEDLHSTESSSSSSPARAEPQATPLPANSSTTDAAVSRDFEASSTRVQADHNGILTTNGEIFDPARQSTELEEDPPYPGDSGAQSDPEAALVDDADTSLESPAQEKHVNPSKTKYHARFIDFSKRMISHLSAVVRDTWWPEALGLTFSASCLVALSVLLLRYDQKEIPHLASGMTLNTIISILAAASKSALIFSVTTAMGQCKWSWFLTKEGIRRPFIDMESLDDATRGPLGSLQMLFQRTIFSLCSIGAIVVALGLALDPSIQQLVSYLLRPANISFEATTRRANLISGPPNQRILDAGLYGTQFERAPYCPTGNCTWEPFNSMGWCAKCEDYSGQVRSKDCNLSMQYIIDRAQDFSRDCTFTLPTGQSFSFNFQVSMHNWTSPLAFANYMPVLAFSESHKTDIGGLAASLGTNETVSETSPLVNMGYASIGNAMEEPLQFSLDTPFEDLINATACTLSPCAREHQITTVNGHSTVDISNEDYGILYAANNGNFVLPNLTALARQNAVCWQPSSLQSQNLTYEVLEYADPTTLEPRIFVDITNTAWCLVDMGLDFATQTLLDYFNHSVTADLIVYRNAAIVVEGPGSDGAVEDFFVLWNSNMSALFDMFANSLTRNLLFPPAGMPSNDFVNGTVWSDRPFVDVRWPWIALPLSLNLLGIVFLCLAIFYTNKQKLPLWKSSLTAIAYHGIRDESIDPLLSYATASEMAEAASMTSVRLVVGGGRKIHAARLIFRETLLMLNSRNFMKTDSTARICVRSVS